MFRNFVLFVLSAVLVGSAFLYPPQADAQGNGLVNSVLASLEHNHRVLKSLRARISMEKYNSQIGESDKYEGTVLYVPAAGRSANIRLEWERPQHEILAVSNGDYNLYRQRQAIVYKGNTRSSRGGKMSGLFEMMSLSTPQLKARFDVQDAYKETLWGGVNTTHLRLTPKGAASFKYAEIWVDESGMPIQTKVVEKNDDATTLRLTQPERNASYSKDEFHLQLPDGVKVVHG